MRQGRIGSFSFLPPFEEVFYLLKDKGGVRSRNF
jgi:hypothetical protein